MDKKTNMEKAGNIAHFVYDVIVKMAVLIVALGVIVVFIFVLTGVEHTQTNPLFTNISCSRIAFNYSNITNTMWLNLTCSAHVIPKLVKRT